MWNRGGIRGVAGCWLTPALIALFGAGGAAFAQGPGGGIHDLAKANDAACPYCHSEQSAPDPGPPPWNPGQDAGAYTLYRSLTMDMSVAARPQRTSLVCLSCHDATGAGPRTDLSSHHPISLTYDPGRDRAFAAAAGGWVGTLPLFGDGGDQLECVTCHHPHDNSQGKFLRIANHGDALCLTCHKM